MKFSRLISISCVALFFSNLSFAEDWYQIEVIAFEYTHPNASDVELWENQPSEPDWKSVISLTDEATAQNRRKQEEAAKAAAAPPPPPKPEPTHPQEQNMVEQGDHGDDDETDYAPPPPPVPKPVVPEPAKPSTDVPGQKFVTVEEILTGQHGQNPQTQAPSPTPPGQTPLDFVGLPSSQFTMADIERRLHRQGTYKILTHTAWRQAAFTGNNNEGVHIFGGKLLDHEGPLGNRYEFEGLVSLKSTKYLHLDVDALLRGSSGKDQGSKFNAPADLALLENPQHSNERSHVYQVYRLEQSQRVRSNKVYYFDHPLMGVIVKISPYGG